MIVGRKQAERMRDLTCDVLDPPRGTATLRLAMLCDFPDERWPSMDLVAEMLGRTLMEHHRGRAQVTAFCPPFRHRIGRLPLAPRFSWAFSGDRFLNRYWSYPRSLRAVLAAHDVFHVCDHTYAHLVHALPADRTGVFCHDLDAFACILGGRCRRRSPWFRALARRLLLGLQRAAIVFCSTQYMRRRIEQLGCIDPARIVCAPYGVAPEFQPDPSTPAADAGVHRPQPPGRFLLHVGSCIPRKRIDVLLDVFAKVHALHPSYSLVQVGGDWTAQDRARIDRLKLSGAIIQKCDLGRRELAEFYRAASLVLLPSESEGFGLPIIEALSCGKTVVASDLPLLREVGGDACLYCPPGDVSAWAETMNGILSGSIRVPPLALRLNRAKRYSWQTHAQTVLAAYEQMPGLPNVCASRKFAADIAS